MRVAVQHGYTEIYRELSKVEDIGSTLPDPYSDVPEVRPVTVDTVGIHGSDSLLRH